ncbi:MAG: methyltransferase [Pirellulaceae bacterium]
MPLSARELPHTDPTPIFELFRGSYGAELLTAAVAHFDIFRRLADGPLHEETLGEQLQLAPRARVVLLTALKAMDLLRLSEQQEIELTDLAREHLAPGGAFDVGDYVGLAAASAGVLEMVERLRSNRPAGSDDAAGAAFIYRDGIKSAMEQEATARHFTLALAGRAKNVAPVLAERLSLEGVDRLLDVGGGTGIYSIALLQRHPQLQAVVYDRPEVLKVASEMAAAYGVADRLQCSPGDMFRDPLPGDCQAVLLSNVLHDWDVPQCQALLDRCADVLPAGGRVLIHDVFLSDALDGPLPIALYSAALFTLTEGRAYSAAEFAAMLHAAGLTAGAITPTLVHCGVLAATK